MSVRVLMISTSYPANLEDWKGLFIRHLADALARRKELRLHLWAPPGEVHPDVVPFASDGEASFLSELMQAGGIAHLLRIGGLRAVTAPLRLLGGLRAAYRRAGDVDLYHVNWLQNALPLPDDGKPLLVSVLGSDLQLLSKPMMKSLLRRIFRHHRTVICPNADWMVAPLMQAFGDIARVRFVPFGIDPMWYAITRDEIQPVAPARWLAVTRLTSAKLGPLLDWGGRLFRDGVRELHLFGPMQETIDLPAWVHYHGPASPAVLCRDWFPSARGLITLSRHAEGRPQVMLEAMAAGLPIVASRLAAHEGIVFHDETGWLCNSLEETEAGLRRFEDPRENCRAGRAARAWVSAEIGTWDDCAVRYARLYRQIAGVAGAYD
ncbi:MAG: glycosyltransferase family 4 protein [Pseudomonadota bacterium]